MASPLATVVIPNYNGMRFLPRLMESLAAQTDPRWAAVIVDDASADDSVPYLRRHWPEVRLIVNQENRGFAASCNAGMQAATTPFVALLNNDTHLDQNWLAEGLKPFDWPKVGAVASLVLLAEVPHPIDTAGDLYSVAGGALKRGHLMARDLARTLDPRVFSACGASGFYRREAVASVGFLDERLDAYYEDVDLGFRLAWAGYQCVFAPASICYHHLSSSYDPKGWRYHFNSARNAEVVWWSCMPAEMRRRYLLAHLLFLVLQAVNKTRQGCLAPFLAGKWQVIRHHRAHIREKRELLKRLAGISAAEIEALLVRDWWGLHVGSRIPARHPSDSSGGTDSEASQGG